MKKLVQNICKSLFILLLVLPLFVSCKKDDDMEESPDIADTADVPQEQSVDPSQATASLIFDNMKVVSGRPPESKSSGKSADKKIIDLKIDSDTIFWTPGIIKRIKILKPEGVTLSFGAHVYVPGASSYIETTLREEEETDEISILYFDFDPTGWELPITFPLRIQPLGEDGNPTDSFEVPVDIEKPLEAGGTCDLDLVNSIWEWIYYKQDSPSFFTAPMFPHSTPGSTFGCCIDGESDANAICTNTPDYRQLDYEIIFMRPLVFMVFIEDSRVIVYGQVYSRNLDPFTSNFCSNTAGYSENDVIAGKEGDYIINSDCSLSFENLQGSGNNNILDDPTKYIGGGPSIRYTMISDHFMKQTITSSGGPDGRSSVEGIGSMYERRDDLSNGTLWYD